MLLTRLLFITLLSCSLPCYSDAIKVGYLDFPPLYYTQDNRAQGVLIDISRRVLKTMGQDFQEIPMPTKRLMSSLKNGSIDLWCGIQIPTLKKHVITGKVPIHLLKLNAYSNSSIKQWPIETLVKNHHLIILLGFSYGGLIDIIKDPNNQIQYTQVKTHAQALKLLKAKRGDIVLGYQAPFERELQRNEINNFYSKSVMDIPVFFNVSKKMPNAQQFVDELDKVLTDLNSLASGSN